MSKIFLACLTSLFILFSSCSHMGHCCKMKCKEECKDEKQCKMKKEEGAKCHGDSDESNDDNEKNEEVKK